MRRCPKCRFDLPEDLGECPSCGVIFAKLAAQALKKRDSAPAPEAGSGDAGPGAQQEARRPSHTRLLVLTGVLIALYFVYRPSYLADIYLPAARVEAMTEPCEHRERCLMVFLSPSSAEAAESLKTVQDLRDRWKLSSKVGVKIVLTEGEESELYRYSEQVGENSFIDHIGFYRNKLKLRQFPTWIVLDGKRKLLERQAGRLGDSGAVAAALKLSGYEEARAPASDPAPPKP